MHCTDELYGAMVVVQVVPRIRRVGPRCIRLLALLASTATGARNLSSYCYTARTTRVIATFHPTRTSSPVLVLVLATCHPTAPSTASTEAY
eukprot:565106-Rhodomonas_salina.1